VARKDQIILRGKDPGKVPPRAKRLADEMISDLLERRWHDVELIAGLLLKQGRITSEMIEEVLLLEPEVEAQIQL